MLTLCEGSGGIRRLCELVDEYGHRLTADFQQFYGLRLSDVWDGGLAVDHALALAEQLGTIPDSRVAAHAAGSDRFMTWDATTVAVADLHDRITHLIMGAFGKKAPASMLYPRPEAQKPVGTVDDFDTAAFLSGRW